MKLIAHPSWILYGFSDSGCYGWKSQPQWRDKGRPGHTGLITRIQKEGASEEMATLSRG